ncbi:outer membrane protein [Chenggangzhangella methanolivorans]|uniref:Porin family protein n=1 Tax=Chenggangzhangella methanolivorans TaxID=1437009 RepID=A0A9E6UMI4_9HYPH|nr:outer membrane protein [Chenggangzhangella methanolivorans]QZN99223.1 porin family protein [Chenggangzhangella methanolivorans]
MIRHIALGVASAAALALAVPAAQAADLPAYEPAPAVVAPVPSFSWSGPYIGAQVGHGWQRAVNQKSNGWMLGGFLGYNYQFDASPVVVGVETDFNWSDQDGRKAARGGTTRTNSDWNGATRARVGYAWDRVLVYGAAGLAYADREVKRSPGGKDSKTATGWTVGGGVDVAVTDNVFVRGEYRYTDYGKDTFRLPNSSLKSSATEHRVMGGLAVKFDSPF